MGKGFVTAGISAVFIAVLAFFITAPVVNDYIARQTADELASLPLPNHTELVETVYKAGKLTGNGNGMQYFGAILIKSDLSLEELKIYYTDFSEYAWDCTVERQANNNINVIEHIEMAFKTNVSEADFFIVYSWGDNDTIFHEFDLRGH